MDVPVPFPQGLRSSKIFPKGRERLVNCFNSDGKIFTRPGITALHKSSGFCRGSTIYRRRLFHAAGTRLNIIPESAGEQVADLGELLGSDQVFMSGGNTMMMVLARGGQLLKWEDTGGNGTLTDVTDTPNFATSVDMCYIDGRWIYVPADGGPLFFSEPGDGANINPLNFFDAELLPDVNLGVINVRNQIWVLGEELLEPFRATGDVDAPFRRVDGGQIESGYISARIQYAGTFAYIGRPKQGEPGIFIAGQGMPERLSNEAVDEILAEYTRDELFLATSQRYTWRTLDTLVFSLPRHTLAFANGNWHELCSFDYSLGRELPWRAVHAQYANGQYVVGDATTDDVGVLDTGNREYGQQINRDIFTYIRNKRKTQMVLGKIYVDSRAGLVPTLEEPTYADRQEAQMAAQWQVATDDQFTAIVYDSGEDLVNFKRLQMQNADQLSPGTMYYWRVRYKGEVSGWSDWSAPTDFTTGTDFMNPPYGISPAFGALDQEPDNTTLVASDPVPVGNAGSHQSSQFQVALEPSFMGILYDSGSIPATTSHEIPDGFLGTGTIYYWRVRYEGSVSGWSQWSTAMQFTTITAGVQAPNAIRPADGEVNTARLSLVLIASAFIDINTIEAHEASEWQIATDEFFTNIVYDSGETTTDLTEHTVSDMLNFEEPYYWRVRYKGNVTGYGPYSLPARFITLAVPDYARVTHDGSVRIINSGEPRVVVENP